MCPKDIWMQTKVYTLDYWVSTSLPTCRHQELLCSYWIGEKAVVCRQGDVSGCYHFTWKANKDIHVKCGKRIDLFHFSGTGRSIPANQRPWRAFTVAIAAGIEGHFTYTFPCNDKNKSSFYFCETFVIVWCFSITVINSENRNLKALTIVPATPIKRKGLKAESSRSELRRKPLDLVGTSCRYLSFVLKCFLSSGGRSGAVVRVGDTLWTKVICHVTRVKHTARR